MSDVLVIGAGPVGLVTGMLLAGDGHRVTVLDQDAGHPGAGPDALWRDWQRPGVRQFRQPHILMPGGAALLEKELPAVIAELRKLEAQRYNLIEGAQPLVGGALPGDERYETLGARRPVIEGAIAAAAGRTEGLSVRRGVTVTALVAGEERVPGRPHVAGVVTDGGEVLPADLVVDASGRNSRLHGMLTHLGAPKPLEERVDTGFIYYSVFFAAHRDELPKRPAWPAAHHDSVSTLLLPGDNNTWSLLLIVSGRDRALRVLHEEQSWHRAARLYPGIVPWLDGKPLTGVQSMAGLASRYRRLVADDEPVATGVVALGDAWAATNPLFGFGLTMGIAHSVALRDLVRELSGAGAAELPVRFDEVTEASFTPIYRKLETWDRHRLAEIDGSISGIPYETDAPEWNMNKAVTHAKLRDPDILRGAADIASLYAGTDDVLARPGLKEKVINLGAAAPRYPSPGPSRADLLAAIEGR